MIILMNFSILMLLLSFFFMMLGMMFMIMKKMLIMEWLIYSYNSMKFNMFFMIDYISMFYFMLVLFISSIVLLYSTIYMNMEMNLMKRFCMLVVMFVISMCLMIISPSILTILLGWDGLGLISYCLVIYYQNFKALSAGLLTVLLNRLGDCCLLMMISMTCMFGSWNLFMYELDMYMKFLLIIMAFTKSAQYPFSSWLPEAMMAPTPVSSLVHSSTLVTAGIYLFIRYSNMMMNNNIMNMILFISSITMLISGLCANFEFDFKKIIALSTLSQLSFMFSILSLSLMNLALMHLFIHALFKSLMFMSVGMFIFYNNGYQDLRKFNGMFYNYPMNSMIFIFSTLSLCGFPFLVGFYSKDMMLEEILQNKLNLFSMMMLMLSTILTVSYSFRMILILLINNYNKNTLLNFKENYLINMCMIMMMFMSIFFSKFYYNMNNINIIEMSLSIKLMVLKLCLMGMFTGFYFYSMMNLKLINKYGFMFKELLFMKNIFKSYKMLNYMYQYEYKFEKIIKQFMINDFMTITLKIMHIKIYYIYFYMMIMLFYFTMIYMIL